MFEDESGEESAHLAVLLREEHGSEKYRKYSHNTGGAS